MPKCLFFSSRRRHTRCLSDWSSDVCSSDLRRTQLPAEVRIVDPEGAPTIDADGAATSVQAAELTIPADAFVRLWSAETLERLARTYWRFLERSSLGVIRVRYSKTDRAVVLLCRPFVLIGFDPP